MYTLAILFSVLGGLALFISGLKLIPEAIEDYEDVGILVWLATGLALIGGLFFLFSPIFLFSYIFVFLYFCFFRHSLRRKDENNYMYNL